MNLLLLILPIALIIFCGQLLVLTKVMPRERWEGVEILSFRLLIPAVLIKYIASSNLSVNEFAPMIIMLVASLGIIGAFVLLLRKFVQHKHIDNPTLSTLFQTATRWNAFITLVAVDLFIGEESIVLVAVAMAVLIPLINVMNIVILSIYGKAEAEIKSILKHVFKNPIVQSCIIGLAINISDLTLPTFIIQTLDIIGGAAIGVGLLAVGAGINPSRFFKISVNLWLGVVLRLIALPVVFLIMAEVFELGHIETLVGVLVLAVPTATNGFVVAKQMGGNASLYADVLSWQVLLSMFLLPLYMAFLI